MINGEIVVKVLDVRGGRVKLGCEYPEGSTVFRQELFEKIRDENKAAAGAGQTKIPDGLARLLQDVGRPMGSANNKDKEQGDANNTPRQSRRDGDDDAE